MRRRSWVKSDLLIAVKTSYSIRSVLNKIGLKPTGGNYLQIKKYFQEFKADTTHFRGKTWNRGLKLRSSPKIALSQILVENSDYQSYKLRNRLFREGLKSVHCEICGWNEKSVDGRIPLELDHINGNRFDNRLINLRILCPNCHSLQPTHRGRNIRIKLLQ